jgi:very-short-patch-repair endonuclease
MRSRLPLSPHRTALLAERALLIRAAPTPSEARLWSALRGRQLGVQFRRQVVIGECIVDFLAAEVRLVVEVDGGSHCGRERADTAPRSAATRRGLSRRARLGGAGHAGLAGGGGVRTVGALAL